MNAFLTELGRKAAERWFDRLLFPGLLWLTTVVLGLRLGQGHPFAVDRVTRWLDGIAAHRSSHDAVTIALVAAGVLVASTAAGQAAAALGAALQRLWALPGDRSPAGWLRAWRQARWDRVTRQLKSAVADAARSGSPGDPARRREVAAWSRRRDRLGPGRPTNPTRIGDRFHATAVRILNDKGLHLDVAWPRLWAVVPEPLRTDLGAAQEAYASAARLTAWGVLYLPVAAAWWPALPLGVGALVGGIAQGRARAAVVADLLETCCDLHTRDLAEALGLPSDTPLPALGQAVQQRLRPAATPPAVTPPAATGVPPARPS